MKKKLLEILVCPKCSGHLDLTAKNLEEIPEGNLTCANCTANYFINDGIPRFVEPENYAASFGYQWNLFRKEQLDSYNGTTLSAERLWAETGWTAADLKGKWVLDVGCGAGRFLDASSVSEAEIVGVDISSAIDAAQDNLKGRKNVHFVQAGIYDLPFRPGTFDYVYCIGVIQHTPDTDRSLKSIAEMVKPNGAIAVTIYERKPWTKLFSKYWLRSVTKRMRKEMLLNFIQKIMPVAFPTTNMLFRIPVLGKAFMFVIPIANYVSERQLSPEQRYKWAILDTFDMLSPAFDHPMTEEEARKLLTESGFEVARSTAGGLNLAGRRRRN